MRGSCTLTVSKHGRQSHKSQWKDADKAALWSDKQGAGDICNKCGKQGLSVLANSESNKVTNTTNKYVKKQK